MGQTITFELAWVVQMGHDAHSFALARSGGGHDVEWEAVAPELTTEFAGRHNVGMLVQDPGSSVWVR